MPETESGPHTTAVLTPRPAGVQPPPQSRNLPPPQSSNQPPPQSSTQPPPTRPNPYHLWEAELTRELDSAIRPPNCFYDPVSYTDDIIWELQDTEYHTLRAASLTQTLATVHTKYCKAMHAFRTSEADKKRIWAQLETCKMAVADKEKVVTELQVFQEEKKKTYEELLTVKENFKTANQDLLALRKVHADLSAKYEILSTKAQGYENSLAEIREKLEKMEDKLKDDGVEADILRNDLSISVEGSFTNALDQIKLLNLGIKLNLSGVHHLTFMNDGKLIPPPSPTPSPSRVDGDVEVVDEEEEVNTADPPVADDGEHIVVD